MRLDDALESVGLDNLALDVNDDQQILTLHFGICPFVAFRVQRCGDDFAGSNCGGGYQRCCSEEAGDDADDADGHNYGY